MVTIHPFQESEDPRCLADLAGLLQEAVDGGASLGFRRPLDRPTALAYWQDVFRKLSDGHVLLVARDEEDGRIVGTIQLEREQRANSLHRAHLQKAVVLRSHRGQGIGARLIAAGEEVAREGGLKLLVLGAKPGVATEHISLQLGWTRVGVIPGYSTDADGELHDLAYLCKTLA